MKYFQKELGIFYITNVCNLTCKNCDSYNNRNFKGHFYWDDNKDQYYKWASRLQLGEINIYGGEPYTNPDLKKWVVGLKDCFKNTSKFSLSTNGTHLKNNIDLSREIIETGFYLDVCCHDPALRDQLTSSLDTILSVYSISTIKKNNTIEYYVNDTMVAKLWNSYVFHLNSADRVEQGITFFRRSDIVSAHESCIRNCLPSIIFLRGKMYKCYLTAISQDLTTQFQFEEEGSALLNSYVPAQVEYTDEQLTAFFEELKNPIAQCKLCAERDTMKPIWPLPKKKQVL